MGMDMGMGGSSGMLALALPPQKEPMKSSALQRKISGESALFLKNSTRLNSTQLPYSFAHSRFFFTPSLTHLLVYDFHSLMPLLAHSFFSLLTHSPHNSHLTFPTPVSEKPWIRERDRWERLSWWATFSLLWVGVGAAAVVCFFGFQNVQKLEGNLCSVLDDEFESFNTDNWQKDVELSGFG